MIDELRKLSTTALRACHKIIIIIEARKSLSLRGKSSVMVGESAVIIRFLAALATKFMAKTLSIVFGIVFAVIGLLAFVTNPIVGMAGFFETNRLHDAVHLISGVAFLIIGFAAMEKTAALWLKVFGAVYLLVAVLGFFVAGNSGMGQILGLITVNGADNWLHVALGLVFLLSGIFTGSSDEMGMRQA